MEKEKHFLLKKQGRLILISEGFKEDEIFEEHTMKISQTRSIRVDLIGINNKKRVIIECGAITETMPLIEKINILRSKCDKLINLPYLDVFKGKRGAGKNKEIPLKDIKKEIISCLKKTKGRKLNPHEIHNTFPK